jgi:CheY-like chemotaxis protein
MSAKHILVAEDDRSLLDLLEAYLQSQGYLVTGVTTVGEALQVIKQELPDLLLLDLTLLGDDPFAGITDGFAFLHLLRLNYPAANFPVIIHSGDDSPQTEAHAQALGVFAVLKKGCPMPDLLGAIRQALSAWSAPQAA